MEDLPINLELKFKHEPLTPVNGDSENKFPTLHYEGPKDLDLPQTGEMMVRYRVKEETSTVDVNGVHHYKCDIEVSEIKRLKGDESFTPPAKSGSEAGNALDRLRDEMENGAEEPSEY